MVHKSSRPTVHDMRAMKARGEKISMLYVTTLDEAAAADAAGIHMLSIESRFFSPEMREAAGKCFVQVGLPFGPYGKLVTAEDYLRAAFHFTAMGGDCFYCAASLDIQKALCDNHMPIVAHVGLIRPTSPGPAGAPSARPRRKPALSGTMSSNWKPSVPSGPSLRSSPTAWANSSRRTPR